MSGLRTSRKLVWLCLVSIGCLIKSVQGGLVLTKEVTDISGEQVFPSLNNTESEVVVFDLVVGKYRFFGPQSGSLTNTELKWMSKVEHETLCQGSEDSKALAWQSFRGKVVMIHENLDFTCNGKYGSLPQYQFLPFWCNLLEATLIIRMNIYLHPGLWANEHDGTRFESMYEKDANLRNCWWGQVQYQTEASLLLKQYFLEEAVAKPNNISRFWVDVMMDDNDSFPIFENPVFIVIYRAILPGLYLITAYKSLRYLLQRVRQKTCKPVHAVTLTVNCIESIALGVVEAFGNKYMSPNLPAAVVTYFYTVFFSSSVATDYLIALQYRQSRVLMKSSGDDPLNKYFRWVAAFLFLLDILTNSLLTAVTGTTYSVLVLASPTLFVVLQMIIIIFLFYETLALRGLLGKIVPQEEDPQDNYSKYFVRCQAKLEHRLRFWVRVSATCALGNVCLYYFLATRKVETSPLFWSLFWVLFHIMKLGNLISQVKVSAPPPSFKPFEQNAITETVERSEAT